jgi:hypothetical protein
MDRTEVRFLRTLAGTEGATLLGPSGRTRLIVIASLAQFDGSSDLAEVIETPYGIGRTAK